MLPRGVCFSRMKGRFGGVAGNRLCLLSFLRIGLSSLSIPHYVAGRRISHFCGIILHTRRDLCPSRRFNGRKEGFVERVL